METTTSKQLKKIQNKTNSENRHLVFLIFNNNNTRCLFKENRLDSFAQKTYSAFQNFVQ